MKGSTHFNYQRLSAYALIPVLGWFLYMLPHVWHLQADHVKLWISSPLNSILLSFLTILTYFHGYLGLEMIMEDYTTCETGLRVFKNMTKVIFLGLVGVTLYALYNLGI